MSLLVLIGPQAGGAVHNDSQLEPLVHDEVFNLYCELGRRGTLNKLRNIYKVVFKITAPNGPA